MQLFILRLVAGRATSLPVAGETCEKRPVAGPMGAGLIQHDDVEALKRCPVLAERLPCYPFQAVAPRRQPAVLLGNRQTKPGAAIAVVSRQYRE